MINQKKDTNNYSETILLIVLAILFAFTFASSNKSDTQTSYSLRYEFESGFHSNHVNAVIIDAIQLPSVQKSCVQIIYNTNFNLFNERYKIFVDNRKMVQSIILLQKTQLLIKPVPINRFYSRLISSDTEDLPILS